jgi:hypothetical protein
MLTKTFRELKVRCEHKFFGKHLSADSLPLTFGTRMVCFLLDFSVVQLHLRSLPELERRDRGNGRFGF